MQSDYVSLLSNVQGYSNIKDETYEIITNSKFQEINNLVKINLFVPEMLHQYL